MKKFLPLAKIIFGWPFSLLAIFFLYRIIASRQTLIANNISHINFWYLLYSIFFFLLYFLFRGYLWKRILEEKGVNMPLRQSVFLWELAEVKRFIPGNIWSVVSKTVLFANEKLDKFAMTSSLAYEAQLVMLGSGTISFLSLPYLFTFLLPNNPFLYGVLQVAIAAFFVGFLMCVFQKKLLSYFKNGKIKMLLLYGFPGFSQRVNLNLILTSAITFFFYGLGTYFSIASFTFLNPAWFLNLSGFFTLSLLIGYLSFITPMGIGVREASVVFGLTPILGLVIAGFASLFTRVILIASEVLFLGLMYIWSISKYRFVNMIHTFLHEKKYEVILCIGIAIYAFYFTSASFLRYENFYAGRFDLGNADQAVWNTFRGRIFQSSSDFGDGISMTTRLSGHADFILILIAPLYFIWTDPKTLLLLQTVVLALGAVFVYLLAWYIIKNKTIALVFSFTYLINPGVNFVNLYDFHAVALSITLLLGAFYFLYRKKYILFTLFSLLSALTKEQVWIICALLGLFILVLEQAPTFLKRKRFYLTKATIFGFSITVFCTGMFYFLVWYAIPKARGGNHFALEYYKDFGDTPTGIVKNIFLSPVKVAATILQGTRLEYLYKLFTPLGYLSLLAPVFLIFALPDLLINLLSNNTQLHQIYYQYNSTILPFLFISAISGVSFLFSKYKLSAFFVSGFLLVCSIYSAFSFGPLPFAHNPSVDMFTTAPYDKEFITSFISKIPKRYTISATNNLGAHLSERRRIFTVPVGMEKSDMVLFLLDDQSAQPSLSAQWEMVENLKKSPNYKLIIEKNDFIVFKRKSLR